MKALGRAVRRGWLLASGLVAALTGCARVPTLADLGPRDLDKVERAGVEALLEQAGLRSRDLEVKERAALNRLSAWMVVEDGHVVELALAKVVDPSRLAGFRRTERRRRHRALGRRVAAAGRRRLSGRIVRGEGPVAGRSRGSRDGVRAQAAAGGQDTHRAGGRLMRPRWLNRRNRGAAAVMAGLAAALWIVASACAPAGQTGAASGPPTVAEATEFVAAAEERLLRLVTDLQRAGWVQSTYITEDTEILAAQANERFIGATVELAKAATRFDGLDLPEDVARKLSLLTLALTLPAPDNDAERAELTRIAASMESVYGKGEYCPEEGECKDLGELSRILASSRDPAEMLDAWVGWRTISPPMRADYQRFAELGNKGARELGFADLGAMWRSKYDMPPEEFTAEVDRLWGQVKPLYDSLHCYVRSRLSAAYGADVVPPEGPLPAHLLGNMWAQSWNNVYPLVAPPDADPGFDLTERLKAKEVDEIEMVRYGERFFSSLGFAPLPDTFWTRSLFKQPADRDVVCHASAWDIDTVDDIRIKMCIEINDEDFATVHHELGHNYYQRAYSVQPLLFRDSANDGFHEGVGDTVSLSVTPKYLVDIGLLERETDPSKDLGILMKAALDKIAFLPFGLLVDQWRWQVFSGDVPPERYNVAWWELRERYQGVAPPVERSEADFDPGAKYHIPANTPYTRYFLAHILQFQFHRALCAAAGYEGPLHRCSIYGNAEAGRRLIDMLEMGASRPWPDALEAISGQREMDATAILDYFAPLHEWLDQQNEGQTCGW